MRRQNPAILEKTLVLLLGGGIAILAWAGCGSGSEVDSRGSGKVPVANALTVPSDAPAIESLSLVPAIPLPGEVVQAHIKARGGSSSSALAFSYVWRLDGRRLKDEGSKLRLTDARRGSHLEVMVIARDGRRESPARRASARVGNRAPELKRVVFDGREPVTADQALRVVAEGSDPDGDPVEYRYGWFVNGARRNVGGSILPPGSISRGDRVGVLVVATDGAKESVSRRTRTVVISNASPRVESEPGPISPDGTFRYTPVVSDVDGDRLFRFSLVESPSGMRIDPVDGSIEWRPSEAQAGSHPVVLRVDDRNGGRAQQSFRIDVSFQEFPVARRF